MHFRCSLWTTASGCLFIILASLANAQMVLPNAVSDLAKQIAQHVRKEQKTRIAVMAFQELPGPPTVIGTYVPEQLVTDLVNAGNLVLVERATLDKVIAELKLNESGAVAPDAAKQVGRLVGADAIITGTITDLQSYLAINCRLIDTQTGRIFAAAASSVIKDDDIKRIMNTTVKEDKTKSGHGKLPSFATESYRLTIDALHKVGSSATLTTTVESLSDKPLNYGLIGCYLLDENGERWNEQRSNSFGLGSVIRATEVVPGTRVKSNLNFNAVDSSAGSLFTLICAERWPQNSRKVVVAGIHAQ